MTNSFRRIETPQQLQKYVIGVKEHIKALVIIGRGGTGKTSIVRKHFPDDPSGGGAAWKGGRLTAVQFYHHLHDNAGRTIVMDDVPGIAKDNIFAGLLLQVCETQDRRTVSWATQNKTFESLGIPSRFETDSPFIMIANQWFDDHPMVKALETRCLIVNYDPAVELLHDQASDMPRVDRAVWDYVDGAIREGRVHQINFRDYINASVEYRIGVDWRATLEQKFLPDDVDDLDSDEDYVLGWARRHPKKEFAARDLLMGRRFRNLKWRLDEVLAQMVEDGVLEEIRPAKKPGQKGRPPGSRYALATKRSRPVAGSALAIAG